MSDEAESPAERAAREKREADLVGIRISELRESPIRGSFDADHLKAVHAYIFQDSPHHQPGITRDDTPSWVKHRALEGQRAFYDVPYAYKDIEKRITDILHNFGGADALRGLASDEAAASIAKLYGDLDHAHGFYEGNSRTLREFTRELAAEAGFELDWTRTGVGAKERNELYAARDIAVLERAYPGLTPEKAAHRTEYEASLVLTDLRRAVGVKALEAIIYDRMTGDRSLDRAESFRRDQGNGNTRPARSDERESHVTSGRNSDSGALRVADAISGIVMSLVDFVAGLLGGSSQPPLSPTQRSQADQIRAQRQVHVALERIRDSMERGRTLKAEDIKNLAPAQLENIRAKGDDYLRNIIDHMEYERARERNGRGR